MLDNMDRVTLDDECAPPLSRRYCFDGGGDCTDNVMNASSELVVVTGGGDVASPEIVVNTGGAGGVE